MIRLTLILVILIVVAMIVLPNEGGKPEDAVATAQTSGRPPLADLSDDALVETEDGELVLVTAEGEEFPIDLVIEPSALTEADAQVNLPPAETSGGLEPVLAEDAESTPEAVETAETGVEPPPDAPEGTRLRVTGDRVNFRAGPSTDDAILAALTLGTEVELIERVADGWAHLRVPESGLSGYMSEDFLEPAN